MSKTFFNISEQKTNVINFIKKHKNILCIDYGRNAITTEYLDKLKNANTNEFFRLAQKVQLKFGRNFYIFSDNFDDQHRTLAIWLPYALSKFASDKAIKEFCGSKSFDDVIATRCSWFNITPKRWETFEAVFDYYDKPKTSSKKTAKKTAKKTSKKTAKKVVKPEEVKLSDSAILKKDIAFINFEAKEFDHLMNQGGCKLAVYIDYASECNSKNQIDHLINAFKLAKNEADSFIEILETAKKNGAKHVVDSSYTTPTVFDFTK